MSITRPKLLRSVIAASVLTTSMVHAAGFAIIENSASGMGSAFSSGGAAGEDASTVWFNPASMTLLKGQNAVVAGHLIVPTADFTNDGSTNADGSALSGPDSQGGKNAFVPNLYYVGQVTDSIYLGVSLNAPFGLGTKYDDDWVGRYHAVNTELTTINFNPAIAWRINEQWSIGAGASLQYVDVTLTSAVDTGALLGSPNSADSFASLTADNTDSLSYGWNVGLVYEPQKSTRISLAYRSSISHDVKGDADFTMNSASGPIVSTGIFTDTTLYATVELPASASLSLFQNFNDFDLMADVTWTNWSVFEELRIKYDNPKQPDSVTTENYQDQWRAALGGRYHLNEAIVFRAGLAYDQKAVKSAEYRTPRIPDNDRIWTSLGMGWQFSEIVGMDLGYSHLFVADTSINNTFESSQATLAHTLKGNYDASVDIFSAQLNVKF